MSATDRLLPGQRVHLIGICGAGMSALARVLLERGHPVSGTDLRGGRECEGLRMMGAVVHVGHEAGHVDGADVVAFSTAVPAHNPERARAAELGLPVMGRAELLAELMRDRHALLVAGTHGKTTTTAMTAVVLQSAGLDPSYAIGGTLHEAGTSAHAGSGPHFVAEADESDRSFLAYRPDCAVVTNVELDHHDTFADDRDLHEAFGSFLDRRSAGAPAVVCVEDDGGRALLARLEGPVRTYGEWPGADLRIEDVQLGPDGSSWSLIEDGRPLGRFTLDLVGRHMIANATGAVAAARTLGVEPDAAREGLASYRGTQRRFQRLGQARGVLVVDDYAHHPTELAATLQAARQLAPAGRIIAAFQPHRYSRTAALGADLGRALAGADLAIVTEVYAAGERPVPGVTGALVADAAERAGVPTRHIGSAGELPVLLAGLARSGDLVLTLGAGDITGAGPELLALLEGRRG